MSEESFAKTSKYNKSWQGFRYWRIINSIIFLIALFAPWEHRINSDGEILKSLMGWQFVSLESASVFLAVWPIAILIYIILNSRYALTGISPDKKTQSFYIKTGMLSFAVTAGGFILLPPYYGALWGGDTGLL